MKIKNRLVLIAFLSTILIISKEALSVIPNVELVTLLLILYTNILGLKTTIYITFIFTTVQALIYPPHLWIITYYLIWPILVIATYLLNKINNDYHKFALLGAVFGLSFGAFDSLILSFVYGFHAYIPIWIRGLPWDLVHGLSNYITILILYSPLKRTLEKLLY